MAASAQSKPTFPDYAQTARDFFEPRLLEIGLGESQIKEASLEQLKASLERINECIAKPESFGVLRLKAGPTGFFVVSAEAQLEVGILPLLLQRKKLILDRLSLLSATEGVRGLREQAAAAGDQSVDLKDKLSSIESEVRKWQEQAAAADDARRQAMSAQAAELARIELFERRSRVWQKFLERQSVATIIGAVLLVAMFAFIAASASLGTPIPELISNAFLVILGYFFGQAKSEAGSTSGG